MPTISITGASAQESKSSFPYTNPLRFVVTLSEASTGTVTVGYRTREGSAEEGSDFAAVSGRLTFAAGETTKEIVVNTAHDTVDELDEAFELELFDPTGAGLAGGAPVLRATGFVLDDDGTPEDRALTISDPLLVEGDGGATLARFALQLSETSATPITVSYATRDGSATAGTDYSAKSGTVTFVAGQSVAFVDVSVTGDTRSEAAEEFYLAATVPEDVHSGGVVGTATLLDDDAAIRTLSITGASAQESKSSFPYTNPLRFVVTLSEASTGTVTVGYRTREGSAEEGSDFAAVSGRLTFAAGETTKEIVVNTAHDTVDELDEAFELELFDPTGAGLAGGAPVLRATGFVLDDDGTPEDRALTISDPLLVEGDGGATLARFALQLSETSATPITVSYATRDGSATAGTDYSAKSGTVTFVAGQSVAFVDVSVTGDTRSEAAEEFYLAATVPEDVHSGGVVGTATLLDDDAAIRTLSITGASAQESKSSFPYTNPLRFVVTLSEASTGTVTVGYRTREGSAEEGSDFAAVSGRLTFAAGETTKEIVVNTAHDTVDELDEAFELELFDPTGAGLAGGAPVLRATGFVLDDDGTPEDRALFASNPVVVETDGADIRAVFQITLSEAVTESFAVNYSTFDISAQAGRDYVQTQGTLTFAAGQTTASASVRILDDQAFEGVENFGLSLAAGSGAPTLDITLGTAEIRDGDTVRASNDRYVVKRDMLDVPPGKGVLANDTSSDELTATLLREPNHGQLDFDPDGSFIYRPDAGYDGRDSFTYRAVSETDTSGVARVTLTVKSGPNVIDGTGKGEVLRGTNDIDVIRGKGGSDVLKGRGEDDLLFGGGGRDGLIGGGGDDDLRGGGGADRLVGGAGADRLLGNGGGDVLKGGGGADTIDGGAGADVLFGGAGADRFIFANGYGKDRIVDFDDRQDMIVLDDALWGGNLSLRQVINRYAEVAKGDLLFDFGKHELTIASLTEASELRDNLILV